MTDRNVEGVRVVLPQCSDDLVSELLRDLTRRIVQRTGDETGYGLGGRFGYGENYENDVFMMHRYCWCERADCPWCLSCDCTWSGPECADCKNDDRKPAPNFLHKPSGAMAHWYKYIGRGMEISDADWPAVIAECVSSLKESANGCDE
jgi:hypothetical protein